MQFAQAGTIRLTGWLPDGRIVFASNRGPNFDIYALDPATGATIDLTQQSGDEVWAAALRRVDGLSGS